MNQAKEALAEARVVLGHARKFCSSPTAHATLTLTLMNGTTRVLCRETTQETTITEFALLKFSSVC